MAKLSKWKKLKLKRKRAMKVLEPNKCRFCREKIADIDYKDIQTLSKLLTTTGKLFSRKRSGNCAKHQRQAKVAIKRARQMALLPFVGEI